MRNLGALFLLTFFSLSLSAQDEQNEVFKLILESDLILLGQLTQDKGDILLVEIADIYKGNSGLNQEDIILVKDEVTLGCGFVKDASEEIDYGIFFLKKDNSHWKMTHRDFVVKFYDGLASMWINECELNGNYKLWKENIVQFTNEFHLNNDREIVAEKSSTGALKADFLPLSNECYLLLYPELDSSKKSLLTCRIDESHLPQKAKEVQDTMIFVIAETMPTPTISLDSLISQISDQLYEEHKDLAVSGIQGRMYFSLLIEKDGQISKVKTLRSLNPILEKSTEEYLAQMPAWNPAIQRGKEVRSRIVIPVRFPPKGKG